MVYQHKEFECYPHDFPKQLTELTNSGLHYVETVQKLTVGTIENHRKFNDEIEFKVWYKILVKNIA